MEEKNNQSEKIGSQGTKGLLGVEKFLETTRRFFESDISDPESVLVMEE